MKTFFSLIALATFLSSSALAQAPGAPLSAAQIFDNRITSAEQEIVPAAEAMPGDKFTFVPVNGEFKKVRSFAEQVKHLAAANYQIGARLLGEEPPHHERNESAPDSLKTKGEILEYLKGSFAYLHKAAAAFDDTNLVTPIPNTTGTWQRTRLGLAIDVIAHDYDHYGQMVEYLRMNGIVPPASR
jgi:uncharacterized damage-inducible protein DinB